MYLATKSAWSRCWLSRLYNLWAARASSWSIGPLLLLFCLVPWFGSGRHHDVYELFWHDMVLCQCWEPFELLGGKNIKLGQHKFRVSKNMTPNMTPMRHPCDYLWFTLSTLRRTTRTHRPLAASAVTSPIFIPLSSQYGKNTWYGEDHRPIALPSVIDLFPSIIGRLSGSTIGACKKSRRNRQLADALSHEFSTDKPSIPNYWSS
jgi:hypothetical protein